jgi:hypothetical protein
VAESARDEAALSIGARSTTLAVPKLTHLPGAEQTPAHVEKRGEGLTPLEELAARHSAAADRERYKMVKELANVTPHDAVVEQRQKNGQLRFGDVICLSYHEKLGSGDTPGAPRGCGGDYYRSLVFSDGVTD